MVTRELFQQKPLKQRSTTQEAQMRIFLGALTGVTTMILLGSFAIFSAQSQTQGRFDSCTLTLFDSSLKSAGSRTITVSNLVNLPNGVQRAFIPDLSVAGVNFAKRTNAYSFRCQTENGKPQSNLYLTVERFCENTNLLGRCYTHSASSIVVGISDQKKKKKNDTYSLTKADFSVLGKDAYSSFTAIIRPR
jgi:hypothetical protein